MKSYAVIGLGRFGSAMARSLYEYGEDVLAIDIKAELVDDIADHVTRAVEADAKDKDTLKSLGVQNCDTVIVGMGSDLAASVLITMNLKTIGVKEIICKAHDETHREILEKLGADRVIIPEHVVAEKLARTLASTNIMEYIDLSEECGVVEYKVPSSWVGKALSELHIRSKYGVNVIAVKEQDKVKVAPASDYRPGEGTTMLLIGEYQALERIRRMK